MGSLGAVWGGKEQFEGKVEQFGGKVEQFGAVWGEKVEQFGGGGRSSLRGKLSSLRGN